MSAQQPFFTFSSNEEITMISLAAHDALRKKQFGAKLNYKEAVNIKFKDGTNRQVVVDHPIKTE